jgi:hypothetical protein
MIKSSSKPVFQPTCLMIVRCLPHMTKQFGYTISAVSAYIISFHQEKITFLPPTDTTPSVCYPTVARTIFKMSGSTKYTPAAQRDSFDDSTNYTGAPPSYEDQPSSSHDQAALLGGPRSSDDNIPDDFKVREAKVKQVMV